MATAKKLKFDNGFGRIFLGLDEKTYGKEGTGKQLAVILPILHSFIIIFLDTKLLTNLHFHSIVCRL